LSGGETAPPAVQKLAGKASGGFDVVSCMFALHYFFRDRGSVDGFLRNVADNLKVGGYFTGCCFDGDTVHTLLAKLPSGGVKTGRDGGKDIWSIRRSYDNVLEDVLPPNDTGLGRAIDVFFMSIGEEHREFLVSWDYLVTRMKEIGCELLLPDELASLKLQSSTAKFSESYKLVGSKYSMSAALQDFSFLNRWFIFRRRSQGSVLTVAEEEPVIVSPKKSPSTKANKANMNKPVIAEELIAKDEMALEKAEIAVDEPAPKVDESVKTSGQPIYKFFHGAVLKDDIGSGRKDWARYISSFTHSRLRDIDDPTIVYPSLEAAFSAERFKKGTNAPHLGARLFSVDEALHQKYLKLIVAGVTDKQKYEILEDEGSEIRETVKPASMKRLGAKWNETAWLEARDAVMSSYIQQRYDTDAEFKRILDLVKSKNAILVFHNGTRPSEMGGLIKEGGVIEGQNKLGQMYMDATK
jgi:hypothetical protein